MAFNNVPVNGWPQLKDLEKLNALASQIENMPTFTSNDKAFLEDLPAYPDTDGTKNLTATTTSGNTSLSWEATQSGIDYSETEQNTGQKWIDGKDIYSKTIVFENISAAQSSDPVAIADISEVVKFEGSLILSDRIAQLPYIDNVATYQRSVILMPTGVLISGYANSPAVIKAYVTVYYTKSTN